jgi:hypothetical protein
MSILEFPRVYFRGEVAWDPVTTNNYDKVYNPAPAWYDETNCDSKIKSQTVDRKVEADAFRRAAIDEVAKTGNWNPDGSYRCPFYDTFVNGSDLGEGLETNDAFASAPVTFTGMLVDCEPYGAFSSQLFFDDMSFGIQGGCRIYGKRVHRFNDRYINFQANPSNNMIAGVASVMWQTVFAKDQGLQIDAFDSAVLQRLQDSMRDPDVLGLMVRFVTYRTVYYNDLKLSNGSQDTIAHANVLQEMLNNGGFQPNPARSKLVGTVGLWRRGEAVSEPSDRALISTLAQVPGQPSQANRGPVVGTAFAHTTHKGLALDFSNTIPCANRLTDKLDLGILTVTATDPPPAVAIAQIAKIDLSQYDRAAYEATSGIIDIPFPGDSTVRLANVNLSISGEDGTSYLQEDVLRAVPVVPNLYINEGQSFNLELQIYSRGLPAGPGIFVAMSNISNGTTEDRQARTDVYGRASFLLSGRNAEVTGWYFQASENKISPISSPFSPLIFTYMYQRVLPADEHLEKMEPTWTNVYNKVLAGWNAMAPCMDNWLRLDDEKQVRSYGSLIKRLTDPANFEMFRYMPVTRDLTQGQRTLLYRFLDSPPSPEASPASVGSGSLQAAQQESGGEKPATQLTTQQLSRKMRSGGMD